MMWWKREETPGKERELHVLVLKVDCPRSPKKDRQSVLEGKRCKMYTEHKHANHKNRKTMKKGQSASRMWMTGNVRTNIFIFDVTLIYSSVTVILPKGT